MITLTIWDEKMENILCPHCKITLAVQQYDISKPTYSCHCNSRMEKCRFLHCKWDLDTIEYLRFYIVPYGDNISSLDAVYERKYQSIQIEGGIELPFDATYKIDQIEELYNLINKIAKSKVELLRELG